MTGASRRHNRSAFRIARLLDDLAQPQGCDTYIEGTRLQLGDDTLVYPDVMVTCEGETDEYTVTAPCLVVEVLSPSTSWFDHGRKRTKYPD
jgi:Uma2 family endonuclease